MAQPYLTEVEIDNEDLLDLLEDIDDAIELPCELQDRVDEFLEDDGEDDTEEY